MSAYLFYNDPRKVFTLSSLGWYPQGQNQLGGVPNPSDELIMTVKTTRRTYLRGVAKDTYNGHGWQDTLSSRRCLWVNPTLTAERDTIFDTKLPLKGTLVPGQVTVTMAEAGSSTLLVPQRVRNISLGSDMVLYFNDSSEMYITRDLTAGDTYTVTAPLVIAGDPGL